MAQEQPAPFPDTTHFLDAANDSARNFRAVYVTYLVIASYIAVTILSADDELLFRNGNVQIPIINTGATVERFFIFAPLILLFLHLNVLIQAMFLSTKVLRYTSRLDKEHRNARGLLFPAPLAHLLVAGDRRRGAQRILRAVVFISLVLLPPIILIYAEIHFLTYQSELITWLHRIVILLDILLLWWRWPRIVAPDKGWKEWWGQSPRRHWGAAFASVATGFFVLVIADIPGGTMGNFIYANTCLEWPVQDCRYKLGRQTLVQKEPPPEILATHLAAACKSQNLDDRTDCQTKIEPGSPIWCRHAKPLPLQERAFRYANLIGTILCDADLYLAELQGAYLIGAELQGTNLSGAELQGANLSGAELQGAYLIWAELQDANLNEAELQGADLSWAELQDAYLIRAKLQGADLSGAELQGADLIRAKLQSADLSWAKLQGADLSGAKLQGADLSWAELQGADLSGAKLQGADLSRAYLAGSDISNTNLNLADLRDVDLESKPEQEQLQKTFIIIKNIKRQKRQDQALELLKKAETEEATIAPSSIKDAIFSEGSALYRQLQEPENRELLRTRHFTQTWEDGYDTKLAAYLIDSLSCRDEDNYVTEGIIRSRILEGESRKLTSIFAEKLNLDSKVPSLLCQGVEKPLDILSEYDRTELREIFAESANQ